MPPTSAPSSLASSSASSSPSSRAETTLLSARGWLPFKLPRWTTPLVFAFYMASIMAFLMSAVIVAASAGLAPGYWGKVLGAYSLAMPAAFVCVMLVRPLVARMVAATVHR